MASHSPWRNPPLQEAVFEVRFPPTDDYAIFVGGIASSLGKKFPKAERLDAAEIPAFIHFQGIVRHRFSSENGNFLFQTGADVISVNAISYSGFEAFSELIKEILTSAEQFTPLNKLTRIGIRYINRFDSFSLLDPNSDPFSSLNISLPFKDVGNDKTKEFVIRHVKREADDITIAINITLPLGEKFLFLDVDAFYDPSETVWNITDILAWASKAHDVVYDNFEELVSQTEKERRQ